MVVTIGFFDGVHLGHRRVLRTLADKSEDCAAVTFWPHPRVVLQKDAGDLRLLNTIEEKYAGIREAGVTDIRCMEFTKALASLTAERFIRDCLVRDLGCTSLVLGYDNRFGSDMLGSDALTGLARGFGLDVEIVPPVIVNDVEVSSTCIRHLLADGDVSSAAAMLGYRYTLEGVVVKGNRLGRKLGFPTANMKVSSPMKAIPANGVYASNVYVDGVHYLGMTNIGVRPTVDDGRGMVIETNLFDFDEEIYGKEIKLEFISRIRSEKKFGSLDELAAQLEIDKHRCYGYD